MAKVSIESAPRESVIELGQRLDEKLVEVGLRESALPPIIVDVVTLDELMVEFIPGSYQVQGNLLPSDQVQARQEGICQKRRELYSQCFDEVFSCPGSSIPTPC